MSRGVLAEEGWGQCRRRGSKAQDHVDAASGAGVGGVTRSGQDEEETLLPGYRQTRRPAGELAEPPSRLTSLPQWESRHKVCERKADVDLRCRRKPRP